MVRISYRVLCPFSKPPFKCENCGPLRAAIPSSFSVIPATRLATGVNRVIRNVCLSSAQRGPCDMRGIARSFRTSRTRFGIAFATHSVRRRTSREPVSRAGRKLIPPGMQPVIARQAWGIAGRAPGRPVSPAAIHELSTALSNRTGSVSVFGPDCTESPRLARRPESGDRSLAYSERC
jgi:hypothetical protein